MSEDHLSRLKVAHAQLPRFPGSTCMTGQDVAYVVRSQMKVFATADTYVSDYYAHRYVSRKQRKAENVSLVSPAWVDQKEMIRSRESHLKRDQQTVTQKWEVGNKVLGHVEKADVARPRSVLGSDVATFSSAAKIKPFSSALWRARRAVDAAVSALLDYEEARHLCAARSSDVSVVDRATQDAKMHLTKAAKAVCNGAKPHDFDLKFKSLLDDENSSSKDLRLPETDKIERFAVIDALLALPKGVKLLARFATTLPFTAASSALLAEALQAFDSRPQNNKTFTDLDDKLADDIIASVLPKTPLSVLVDAAETYAEAADTNKTSRDDTPATRLANSLLLHGDKAAQDTNDTNAKQSWLAARDTLIQ